MDKTDMENLKYLLSLSPEEYENWFLYSTEEEVDYALALATSFQEGLVLKDVLMSNPPIFTTIDALNVIDRVA